MKSKPLTLEHAVIRKLVRSGKLAEFPALATAAGPKAVKGCGCNGSQINFAGIKQAVVRMSDEDKAAFKARLKATEIRVVYRGPRGKAIVEVF